MNTGRNFTKITNFYSETSRLWLYNIRKTKMMLNLTVCILLISIHIAIVKAAVGQSQLKLVSVVFRHGDRAPDPVELFPKDPYYGDSFYPQGLGGLTNIGKSREYNLGRVLRTLYSNFLGEIYLPDSINARSTDYKRTKMCLQLVLASLYPPRGQQIWNRYIYWQPIPTNYSTRDKDWLMIPEDCPEFKKERNMVENMPEISAKIESFRPFMNNLTIWTGKNISTPEDMYNLYHILVSETSMGLKLPEWTNDIFPSGKLLDGINLWYEIFSYTTKQRRLNGGKLLQDIIKNMIAIKEGKEKNLKISLYSGHETNVAALLQALGVYKSHVPEYTSAVIIEFYEINSKYYVKVFYYRGIPAALVAQQIPGCRILCPLDKFVDLLSNVTPSNDELVCDKSKKPEEIMDNEIVQNQN